MNSQDLEILLKAILHAMQEGDEARKWKEIESACIKASVVGGLGDKLVPTQVSAVCDPSKGPRAVVRRPARNSVRHAESRHAVRAFGQSGRLKNFC